MLDIPVNTLLDHADNLKGKVVLITGAGGGFGLGCAQLAAKHGAKVVIADLNTKLVEKAVAGIRADGGTCTAPAEPVDVTKPEALRNAFEHSIKEYGRYPDIVFANAGVNLNDRYEEDGEVDATENESAHVRSPRNLTIPVNLNGVLNTCTIAQEYWRSSPSDTKRRLVVLSSMGGITGIPHGSAYAASKHAVNAYWQAVCKEMAKDGNASFEFYSICPFFANTRILEPETLLVLAGIPLVEISLIVNTMIHVVTRPASSTPGGMVLLADNGDPVMASPDEYSPLSPEWTRMMNDSRAKNDGWLKVSAWRRVYRDVARNYYCTTNSGLAIRLVVTGMGVYLVGKYAPKLFNMVPTWVPLAAGTALGLAGQMGDVRRKSDILRAKNKKAYNAMMAEGQKEAVKKDK